MLRVRSPRKRPECGLQLFSGGHRQRHCRDTRGRNGNFQSYQSERPWPSCEAAGSGHPHSVSREAAWVMSCAAFHGRAAFALPRTAPGTKPRSRNKSGFGIVFDGEMGSEAVRVCAFSILLLLTGTSLAAAYTRADASACTPDAFRLCARYIPDAGAIEACLRANRQSLSRSCSVVFQPTTTGSDARQAKQTPSIHN